MTFDLSCQRPSRPFNEVEDQGGMAGLSVCESLCGGGVAQPMQEVSCIIVMGVWWNVVDVMVYPLVLSRLCCNSRIV